MLCESGRKRGILVKIKELIAELPKLFGMICCGDNLVIENFVNIRHDIDVVRLGG